MPLFTSCRPEIRDFFLSMFRVSMSRVINEERCHQVYRSLFIIYLLILSLSLLSCTVAIFLHFFISSCKVNTIRTRVPLCSLFDLFVIVYQSCDVVDCLLEQTFLHTFPYVVVNEGSLLIHQIEFTSQQAPIVSNSCVVADHCHCSFRFC